MLEGVRATQHGVLSQLRLVRLLNASGSLTHFRKYIRLSKNKDIRLQVLRPNPCGHHRTRNNDQPTHSDTFGKQNLNHRRAGIFSRIRYTVRVEFVTGFLLDTCALIVFPFLHATFLSLPTATLPASGRACKIFEGRRNTKPESTSKTAPNPTGQVHVLLGGTIEKEYINSRNNPFP